MNSYVSLATGAPLSEHWTFEASKGIEVDGTPVAFVVMHVGDPPPIPADGPVVNTSVLSWSDVVYMRDLGFLMIGPAEQ